MPQNLSQSPAQFHSDYNADNSDVKVTTTGKVTWGLLNQHHDCYDSERIDELRLLLSGDAIYEPQKFIKKWQGEKQSAYLDRLSFAAYENNFGHIVNDFASYLFAKPLAILPAIDADDPDTPGSEPDPDEEFMQFQSKFTLDGKKMEEFLKCMQTESNATGCAYFGVDFNDDSGFPYAYYIDPNSVLDYQKDDEGNFIFLVLRNDSNIRTSVLQLRDTITSTFTVWTKDSIHFSVSYEQYEITYEKGKEPGQDDVIPKINKASTDFENIPIVECITEDNICVGKLIGELQSSLFMRYTTFQFCVNRGINPLLVYQQGPDLPANGDLSEMYEDINRGFTTLSSAIARGSAVIANTDDLKFVGPDKGPYEIASEQMEKDKNEMYRLVSQMSNIFSSRRGLPSGQTSSSGEAKEQDNRSKENTLTAYAHDVKSWAIKAFKLVFSDVEWIAKGMDNYKVIDEASLLAKIAALPSYRTNIPSLTSYEQVLNDTAYEVHPYTSPGIMTKIQEEIKEAVDKLQAAPDPMTLTPDGKVPPPTPATPATPSTPATPEISPFTGNKALPQGSFTQTGQHVDYHTIYDLLINDYPKEALDSWVPLVPWRGPVEVDVKDISFTSEDKWAANGDGKDGKEKVDKYADIMADKSFAAFNPVILANMPSNDEKYTIIDGRHRVKAAQKAALPVLAYIADVSSMDPSTPHMQLHSKQLKNKS